MSQTGRAIAAVRAAAPWQLHGHGRSVRSNPERILHTVVKLSSGRQDSFRGTAAAIGAPGLASSTQLGALWAANPDLGGITIPTTAGRWLRPITIPLSSLEPPPGSNPDYAVSEYHTHRMVEAAVNVPGTTAAEATDVEELPVTPGGVRCQAGLDGPEQAGPEQAGPEQAGPADVVVRSTGLAGESFAAIGLPFPRATTIAEVWKRTRDFVSFVEIDPEHHRGTPRQLWVSHYRKSPERRLPNPLMLWWALLLGLSSLTRYEPGAWSAAVDLDRSKMAVPLEQVLDMAKERLPARIHDVLAGLASGEVLRPQQAE